MDYFEKYCVCGSHFAAYDDNETLCASCKELHAVHENINIGDYIDAVHYNSAGGVHPRYKRFEIIGRTKKTVSINCKNKCKHIDIDDIDVHGEFSASIL